MDIDPSQTGFVESHNAEAMAIAGTASNPGDTATADLLAVENKNSNVIIQSNELVDFNIRAIITTENSSSLAEEATAENTSYTIITIDSIASTSEPVTIIEDPQGAKQVTIETNEPFKVPNIPRGKKRPAPPMGSNSSLDGMSADSTTGAFTGDMILIESDPHKRQKVDIYTTDEGPKWYETNENMLNISRPIVPSRLSEAFNYLPIFGGRPKSKSHLESFYTNKVKDFASFTDEEYTEVKERVSSCLNKISQKSMRLRSSIPSAGILNDMLIYQPGEEAEHEELQILKKFRLRRDKDVNNIFTKKLKYRGIRLMPLQEDESSSSQEPDLQPGKDVMFRVRIYRPFPYSKQKAYRGRHSVFSRDVILVGSQKLTELRDSFVCANDVDMRVDMSERISDPQIANAKELFPSGFLFINNVFYVDNRPGCHDTTARIREWALHKRGLGRFPVRDMGSVRVDELVIKLGHPEVYVHQGNCEHLFTFSEARLVGPGDPLRRALFPAHSAVSQNQTVYCTTCAEFGAKFIVTNCSRVPFDPAFFCDSCLKLYLYKHGMKVSDFKAYSYRGNEMHSSKAQG